MKLRGERIVLDDDGNILEDAGKTAKVTYPYTKKVWEWENKNLFK